MEAALYKLLLSEEQQVLPANAKVRDLSLRRDQGRHTGVVKAG